MRSKFAKLALATSLTLGGVAGVALATPAFAGAADVASGTVSWVHDSLGSLVGDGTLTQAQADAVESALEAARPADGPRGGHGGRMDLATVATALGMTEDEVRTAVSSGQTIADLAASKGVDVQTVVDAIVDARQTHLAEEVASGELTQEEADARLADVEERATAIVNGDLSAMPGRHGHGPDRDGDDAPVTPTTPGTPAPAPTTATTPTSGTSA